VIVGEESYIRYSYSENGDVKIIVGHLYFYIRVFFPYNKKIIEHLYRKWNTKCQCTNNSVK